MTDRVLLAGLAKLELPGVTVCFSDGGAVTFDGDTYSAEHETFGTIGGFETITEGIGDQAPSGTLTLIVNPGAAPADISNADMQFSRLRTWIVEIDPDTGLVTGVPDQTLDAVVDVPTLQLAKGKRQVVFSYVSFLERLFVLNKGNALSGSFHRKIYPGETGLDNTSGVETEFAWGVASAPRGVTTTSSFNGGAILLAGVSR